MCTHSGIKRALGTSSNLMHTKQRIKQSQTHKATYKTISDTQSKALNNLILVKMSYR